MKIEWTEDALREALAVWFRRMPTSYTHDAMRAALDAAVAVQDESLLNIWRTGHLVGRAEALEEAAKVADAQAVRTPEDHELYSEVDGWQARQIAAAIRKLKDKIDEN